MNKLIFFLMVSLVSIVCFNNDTEKETAGKEWTIERNNGYIKPINPFVEEQETTPEQDETTVITIGYTSGDSVANVLVESVNPIEPTFVVSWKMDETDDYTVVKVDSNTWSIKVDVPENIDSKLRIKVYDSEGSLLEISEKIIKNK